MNDKLAFLIGLAFIVFVMFLIKTLDKNEVRLFFHDGLSLDESKISLLMISFTVFIGISIWSVFALGDIPDNVLYLTLGLGGGITGMNISNSSIARRQMSSQTITNFTKELYDNKTNKDIGGK